VGPARLPHGLGDSRNTQRFPEPHGKDRQVADGKKIGLGREDRAPADLHRVLGRADDRGPDAFERRRQAPGERVVAQAAPDSLTQGLPQITEGGALPLVDIFGHAAREHEDIDRPVVVERRRVHEPARQRRERAPVDELEETRGHPLGKGRLPSVIDPLADREPEADFVADQSARLLQSRDATSILGDEASTDVDHGHRGDLAVAANRQLGRPAADVDAQNPAPLARARYRP